MSRAHYIVGDALKVLATLPDDSIDLCVSSPPYLALRSYLPADDPAKADEMGSEATPGEFVDALLDVAEECRRVLAPHGTLCFELGDSYAGSGGAGGDYDPGGFRDGQPKANGSAKWNRSAGRRAVGGQPYADTFKGGNPGGTGWPADKSLTLIPESFRWALAYGRNPFTGRETPRWRVRNVVRHFRPNPPVGALGDKFRPATSEWVVACESRSRFFDLDAVRGPFSDKTNANLAAPHSIARTTARGGVLDNDTEPGSIAYGVNPAGAPPLDWWADDYEVVESFVAPTFGYPGAHYATFSPKVVARFIEAMCPARVCGVCGEPSRRTYEENPAYAGRAGGPTHNNDKQGASLKGFHHVAYPPRKWNENGFTDCSHDAYRPGRVLDPFGGSGTTAQVATGHGRDCMLVDLDRRNVGLAYERVGPMFLTDAVLSDDGSHLPGWL